MKIFKKIISLILTAAIMASMVCVGTVSAGAAEKDLPYVEMYENSYYKTLDYTFWLQGYQKQMWNNKSFYTEKCTNGHPYGFRYDLLLEDGKNVYCLQVVRFADTISWWLYENKNVVTDKVLNLYSAETGWQDGFCFSISTESAYYKKFLKCSKASVINCMVFSCGNGCDSICADGMMKNEDMKHVEIELHNLNVKLDSVQTSKKNISSLNISVGEKYGYTGKNVTAKVTVKDGSKTLKKGTDYTLSYKNCKEVGTASVTIKGKGNYTGSKTLTYKIVPKKTTLKAAKKSDSKVKLSWTAVKGAEKYQIYYSTDGKTYKKLATASGSKTSVTLSGLDFKKNDYKFKIRSYGTDDGKKYYSSFSNVVTVK